MKEKIHVPTPKSKTAILPTTLLIYYFNNIFIILIRRDSGKLMEFVSGLSPPGVDRGRQLVPMWRAPRHSFAQCTCVYVLTCLNSNISYIDKTQCLS